MTGDLRVLVVDDDFRVGAIHEAYVARIPGFAPIGVAYSAKEAMRRIAADQPDLVLLDIYLPDGSGLEILRRLVAARSHCAVFVISAARDVESLREAVRLGAIGYMIKPFGFATLRERLVAFRTAHVRIAQLPDQVDQATVDQVFGSRRLAPSGPARPGHGFSEPTMRLIYRAVAEAEQSVSATEVAELVHTSRATAQRYLAYMCEEHNIELELRYGSGRPEHRYRLPAGH